MFEVGSLKNPLNLNGIKKNALTKPETIKLLNLAESLFLENYATMKKSFS